MHASPYIYVAHADPYMRKVLCSLCRMSRATVRGMENYAILRAYMAFHRAELVIVADDLPEVRIGHLLDEIVQTEFMVVTASDDYRYRRDLQFMGACRVITSPLDIDGIVRDVMARTA